MKVTINTLDRVSMQAIFNTVVRHLRKQGQAALIGTGSDERCCYRAEVNGKVLKCAVGCLIPDRDYKIEMENKSSNYIFDEYSPCGDKSKKELLDKLQMVHDAHPPVMWKIKLAEVAEIFNLKFNWNA